MAKYFAKLRSLPLKFFRAAADYNKWKRKQVGQRQVAAGMKFKLEDP